jgi:hypothetical protein
MSRVKCPNRNNQNAPFLRNLWQEEPYCFSLPLVEEVSIAKLVNLMILRGIVNHFWSFRLKIHRSLLRKSLYGI